MDGRNVKVEELNERRVRAVKLRLAGVSVAEAATRTGLSQPTVIGALKAYQAGGWPAVPVAPRGRGVKKNIKHLGESAPPAERAATDRGVAAYTKLASVTDLRRLEAQSIYILREAVAEAANPVLLYSAGKDSSVLLHLARKAFFPSPPPFALLHIDTTWKFREMYALRDRAAAESGMKLIVHVNQEGLRLGVNPFVHGAAIHADMMETHALKQALAQHGCDAALSGARRDKEKSRAKERVFSLRSDQQRWDPKSQRPELWKLYNTRLRPGESVRVFPLLDWSELDVWQYILLEKIPVVPLYFAKQRPVVERDRMLIVVDDERMPLREREVPQLRRVRFRALGCYPLTGAIESEADSVPAVIQETLFARTSERHGRVIDRDAAASLEKKRQEGYF